MTPVAFTAFFFLVAIGGILLSVFGSEKSSHHDESENQATVPTSSLRVIAPANGLVPGERAQNDLLPLPISEPRPSLEQAVADLGDIPVPAMSSLDAEPVSDPTETVDAPFETLFPAGPADPQEWIVTESQIADWD
jgi:hypothetical protein